jgi:NAD(P)-dependent dehydrogenase (short-subunit alcohol dehydrogenase family)
MSDESRVVLVTGAAGNLGRAVARAFAAQGDTLLLLGRRRDGLATAFGDETPRQGFLLADLARQDQVDAAVNDALQRFGRIDVLCHLAGGFHMGEAVHETGDDTLDRMLDLNARSLLHAAHAVVPSMLERGRGCIVGVGAQSALKGSARMGAYVASKAMVMRLIETMSAELRERGINVNCVLPSVIDTPENRGAMPAADASKWVSPDDLAQVILFLASDAARAIHGACVPVVGLS